MSDVFQTRNLDALIKALKKSSSKARVGVLGAKTIRGDGNVSDTNAGIGVVHEFGTDHVPQRSFLRVPIADHLGKEINKTSLFDKQDLKEVLESGTMVPWLKKLGILGESIVIKAFETGGYGKWPEWSDPQYAEKVNRKPGLHHNRILEDSGQLKGSITSDVRE